MNQTILHSGSSYRGGFHAFKKILCLEEDGGKVISPDRVGWKFFKSEYISSAWVNPDGTRIPYCIPLDIDAKGTEKKWFDESGKIDWQKVISHLKKKYPQLMDYLLFVSRSTGGKGIHIGIAISPIVKDGSEGAQRSINLAVQVQDRLIRLFSKNGLGADPAAKGVVRDMPNWKRIQPSKYSQAHQLFYNRKIHNQIKRERISVLSELARITNEIPECKKPAKKDQADLLHTNKTTEARLAPLYVDLFENMGQCRCYTMAELMKLTSISRATLRNILVKNSKRPKWLNVNYLGRTEGYELWLSPEFGDIERAEKLIENPEYAEFFLDDLPPPELVEAGMRNRWITSAALIFKHRGLGQEKAMRVIEDLVVHIPSHTESTSCQNFRKIVRSIYRNEPHLFGCKADLPLPRVLEGKYKVKDFTEGGLALQNTHYSLAFTRRGNEKWVILFEAASIISSVAVSGTGYEKQLASIQNLFKSLDKKPTKLSVKGQCMFKDIPVAKKFAKYHGFEFAFEERSVEDKRILKEFRQDHHSPESANVKVGFDQIILRLMGSSNIAGLLAGWNSYVVIDGEIKEARHNAHSSRKRTKFGKQVNCVDIRTILAGNSNWVLGLVEKLGKGLFPIPRGKCSIAHILPCLQEDRMDWPKEDFIFPEMTIKKVRCDGYIGYLDNYYWLGDSWIGRKLQVLDDGANVEFYLKGQFIKEYKRLIGKGAKTEGGANSQWHKAKALDSTYRRKAQKVGKSFDELILAQIEKGKGIINTKVIFQFLRLMDSWPYEHLEAVAKYCLKRGNYSYRFFNSCLEAGVE